MNHHYTARQKAKWLTPGCAEVRVHGHGSSVGYKPNSGTHQANMREATLWFSSQRRRSKERQCYVPRTMLYSFLLRGQRTGTLGPQNLVCSISRLWCKLLRLRGLLISRNHKACRITASQKWLETPIVPRGQGQDIHRTSRATDHSP